VLAGHSSGGIIAHALAIELERAGLHPAGIVLMDTFPLERTEVFEKFRSMLPGLVLASGDQQTDAGQDVWLTAMARYFSLDWSGLGRTDLPTLLVRAEEPLAGTPDTSDWKPSWDLSGDVTVVDVPGNHFTMMADHAAATARAVGDWLAGLAEGSRMGADQ
jgi:thioesterase domain-containing protein